VSSLTFDSRPSCARPQTLLQEYGFTLFDSDIGLTNTWSDYVLDSAIKSRISKIDVEESSDLHPASLLREAGYWE
jgi:hypothetical protein